METPYPPQQIALQPSPAAGSSSSSSPSPATNASVPQLAASSEPRQSRKRQLTEKEEEDASRPATEEEHKGDLEDDAGASRPRGLSSVCLTQRGELARRAADRARSNARRAWMARSASEGGVLNEEGPGEGDQPREKRRRVEEKEEGVENCAPVAECATFGPSHSRPARLQVVPSYQDALPSTSYAPLSPSARATYPSTSSARPPRTPSSSNASSSSALAPPSSATTAPSPFSSPLSPADFPMSSSTQTDLPRAPPRPRLRRRANSLPLLRSPSSPSRAAAALGDSPNQKRFQHSSPSSREKVHEHRLRLQRRGAPPSADPFVAARAGGDAALDPRLVVARLEHAHVPYALSQSELLAVHAVRLANMDGVLPVALSPVSLTPPISKATLRELDMQEIMRNPQLRHDVVFDPNLCFRPNYDGERGERKRAAAKQYWSAISREVSSGCRCTTYHCGALLPCVCQSAGSPSAGSPSTASLAARLPSRIIPLIVELRNILLTLLPSPSGPLSPPMSSSSTFGDAQSPCPTSPLSPLSPTSFDAARDQILDALDPVLLAQQLSHGRPDVPGLAAFLGKTLKMHCAPMRDLLVDGMIKACEVDIAQGLRACFEILELMKLDIANHQLRSLRTYLVQTSVDFERRFLQDVARRSGQSTIARLREWLVSSGNSLTADEKPRTGQEVDDRVVHGLLDLVFTAPTEGISTAPLPAVSALPSTLQLDSYRLQAFHADATDLSVLYLLLQLFQQLAYPARPSPADVDSLRKELWCIMTSSTGSVSTLYGPAAAVSGIPQGPPGQGAGKLRTETWRSAMQDVLLQVAARAEGLKNFAASPEAAAPSDSSAAVPPMPDAKTLALVTSYFENNVTPESKLFQLLQRRLRDTLHEVVVEELASEMKTGPTSFASWWTAPPEPTTMATGGAYPGRSSAARANGFRPDSNMMASTEPSRSRSLKRAADTDDEESHSEDEVEKRQRTGRSSSVSIRKASQPSAVDVALVKNGLMPLADEVRCLGSRIAKVASFNLTVYRSFYQALLAAPPFTPSPSPPSSPTL
ncbi:hypothetical protein JCM11251_006740 [Rhodosporidiobolus azoricus]